MSVIRKILGAFLVIAVLGIAGLAIAVSHNSPCGASPPPPPMP